MFEPVDSERWIYQAETLFGLWIDAVSSEDWEGARRYRECLRYIGVAVDSDREPGQTKPGGFLE